MVNTREIKAQILRKNDMKEYRSAIRSRNMIKRAFIELLDEKAISDISVVDIVNRADISRNTFYAHYDDVFCVLEELENDFIGKLRIYIGEGKDNVDEYTPLPLFEKVTRFIEKDADTDRIFISNPFADSFYAKVKNLIIEKIKANVSPDLIVDENEFVALSECVASGFISLYRQNLKGETALTVDEIANYCANIFINELKK